MSTGLPDIEAQPSEREDACVAGASTADVLRLLSAGATGAILMALGEGPLRTKELTERVPGYAPRTIYRYAGKLAELEVIARDEEPGVPSKVVHSLTDACGTELYELVNRFADASLTRLPGRQASTPHAWASLGLLADLWETGMVEDLACEARSPTELARGRPRPQLPPGQPPRRPLQGRRPADRVAGPGPPPLLRADREDPPQDGPARRHRPLAPPPRRRRGRRRDDRGGNGDGAAGGAAAGRPCPSTQGKCLQLSVRSEDDAAGADGEEVWAEVEADGRLQRRVPRAAPGAASRGDPTDRREEGLSRVPRFDGPGSRLTPPRTDARCGAVAECAARVSAPGDRMSSRTADRSCRPSEAASGAPATRRVG